MTHGQATFVEKGQVNTFEKYLQTSVPQAGSDSADILRKERWPERAGGNQGMEPFWVRKKVKKGADRIGMQPERREG